MANNFMQKRVFIIHGWSGYPKEGWFPWLKNELRARDIRVNVPKMPHADRPKINEWVSQLKKLVGKTDENTFFVGHSIGCQTILRYLETLSGNQKIGGAVFVAGWFTLVNLETSEEEKIAKPWLKKPINVSKIKKQLNKVVVIFSDNDSVVPQENQKIFKQKLGAKIIIEHKKGHFSGNDGIKKLPAALKALLQMIEKNYAKRK